MLRRLGLVLLVAVMVAALTVSLGCGDDEGDDTGTTASGGTEPTATGDTTTETTAGPGTTAGGAGEGSAIFAAQCSSCHGASGEGGGAGPALQTRTDLDQESIEEQVREGGDGMPAFQGQLNDDEIQAVSQYVADEIVQR